MKNDIDMKEYYCIGIKRKSKVKESDLTPISRQLSASAVTLVGDNGGIYIFTNKKVMGRHLKQLKDENSDKTVIYKPLTMGTELPDIKPSQIIEA